MRVNAMPLGARQLITLVLSLCIILPDVLGLQCYNCRGITNYDPSYCFEPTYKRTLRQECRKDEVCEISIHRIDRLQEVIERGCTSNCNGRSYIWNDDFRVYCCNNENLCNGAGHSQSGITSLGQSSLMFLSAISLALAQKVL